MVTLRYGPPVSPTDATTGAAPRRRPTREDALALASDAFLAGERIEMRTLSSGLGIGRSTLYRWFGDRDRLIGEMIWGRTQQVLEWAEARTDGSGGERITRIAARFSHSVSSFEPLGRFLQNEPEAALRVLTTKKGGVQPRVVDYFARLIREERAIGNLPSDVDATALAFAIVRIGEGFLYADQITDTPFDLEMATAIIRTLLR